MVQKQKEQFIKLTHFLGEVLGEQYEVAFHVIEDDGAYLAAIANNHISGRTIHAPLTAFASELIQEKTFLEKDFLCDYKALVGKSKTIRGSTFFIKQDKKLLGILCINHDSSEMQKAISKIIDLEKLGDFLSISLHQDTTQGKNAVSVETLSHSIEDILAESIDLTYLKSGFTLSVQQKHDVINKLYLKGIFNIKGSIPIVAKLLNTSEPSIYRYLQKLKR